MRASVWTSWGVDTLTEPKCIFEGEIHTIPSVGEYVVVRDGFGAETVRSVTHDFVTGEVEISVVGADPGNEYGDCLFRGSRGTSAP